MDGSDRLLTVLAQRVVGVRVRAHRAGTVEGDDGGDVLEVVRFHQPQQGTHGTTVELEDTEGVSSREQVVRRAIVERQVLQVEFLPTVHPDVVERVRDDREVAKPEEVHLDEAERLARRIVELGDDLAVLLAAHDRDDVQQRLAGHDHAGSMHAPLPLQAFQAQRAVEDGLRVGIRVDERAELARLLEARMSGVEHAGQRHVLAHDGGRHRLGQPLPHAEREAEHATGILERLLRFDRAVGDDLGDAFGAVLGGDIVDHLAAATIVEVDVEVGHGHTVGVEEALEDQPVLERVEVGDAHGVRHHGARSRSATGPDTDAVVLRPVDEVGDDEEVPREAHLQDDAGLVLGLLANLVGDAVRISVVQARLDLFDQPAVLGLPLRNREPRHVVRRGVELHLASLRDEQRVVAGLGVIAEELAHLGGSLDVVAVAVELESVGIVERGSGLHAQEGLVSVGLVLVRVVRVIGRDERDVEVLREADEVGHHAPLDRQAVVHDLGEVVLLAEDVLELRSGRTSGVVLPQAQTCLHLSRRAAGRRDESLAVRLQQLPIHARLEVVPLHARQRAQPEEVVHPLRALAPHRHMGVRARSRDVIALLIGRAPRHSRLVAAVRARRHVRFQPDDGLHTGRLGRVVELERRECVAVVGDGDRRHPILGRGLRHGPDLGRSVEHRVLAVHVQMNEGVGCHTSSLRRPRTSSGGRPGACAELTSPST